VRRAQATLPNYLSEWYFLHRWRGKGVPADPDERAALLDEAVERGLVEKSIVVDEERDREITVLAVPGGEERPQNQCSPPEDLE
jgi:hypothetical protein